MKIFDVTIQNFRVIQHFFALWARVIAAPVIVYQVLLVVPASNKFAAKFANLQTKVLLTSSLIVFLCPTTVLFS